MAVEACIDHYGPLVWSMARRMCRDNAEAEDATQDVFVAIWQAAGRFDASVGSEKTFIATIARRRLIDRLRRRVARPDGSSLDHAPTPADPQDGLDRVELQEDADAAIQAMHRLSEDQQAVLRLSIFDGRTYSQIAEALSIPLGTVKTHARRGLIRLRELLDTG